MTKMSDDDKIKYYEEQIAKLKAKKAAQALLNSVEVGAKVTFKYGRGDNRRELEGTVLGTKDERTGRWVAIQAGEGFDVTTYKVRVTDIVSKPAAAPAADPQDPLASA